MNIRLKFLPETDRMRKNSIFSFQRVQCPEITPLELSDLRVEGVTLWERAHTDGVAAALRLALVRWRDGVCAGTLNESAPRSLIGFEAVFLTGGLLEDRAVRAAFSGFPFPAMFGHDPVFAGERGGFELLRARGLSGWVADLGKSQLKISAPGWRETYARDWTRLPFAGELAVAQIPAQRRRLREFIALKLQTVLAETNAPPRAMVFALPTRLDDDGTPGASNYAGMRRDRTLLSDAMSLAGLPGVPLFVLNDAELAALSALTDARLNRFGKVLVLTLGFGIGAAMIQRTPVSPSPLPCANLQ